MDPDIHHEGIVVSAEGDRIQVRLTRYSACGQCRTRQICTLSEKEEKIIELPCSGEKPEPGETVIVSTSVGWARKALLLAYFFPLVVFGTTLFSLYFLTGNESCAGIGSIAALIPYYLVLYLYRHKLEKEIIFTLQRSPK